MNFGDPQSQASPPKPLRCFWEGMLLDGIHLAYYADDGLRLFDLVGRARLLVDLDRREGRLVVAPGQEWCIGHACIVPMLCELLAGTGQHAIHAGCLSIGGHAGARAVLLCGSSGSGKTTTTLALARAGMTFLTDDAAFVHAPGDSDDGPPAVWGLPLACKVHKNTLVLLPWLNDLPRRPASTQDEYVVEVRDIFRPSPANAVAEPRAIVFLGRRDPKEHRLEPLDKVSAVTCLTKENVRAIDPSGQGPGGRAFRLMSRLAAGCDTYRLSVGPDLEGLYHLVAPLLEK
jgi:hypothetical protein